MKLILHLALLILTALATPTWARPAGKPSAQALAEAKAVFTRATQDYDAGRYEAARKGFERAHELSRNPVLYFNLAACDEKLGQALVAVAHLRAYLAEVPNADDAVQVRERIGALEERARHDEERRADEPDQGSRRVAARQALEHVAPSLERQRRESRGLERHAREIERPEHAAPERERRSRPDDLERRIDRLPRRRRKHTPRRRRRLRQLQERPALVRCEARLHFVTRWSLFHGAGGA